MISLVVRRSRKSTLETRFTGTVILRLAHFVFRKVEDTDGVCADPPYMHRPHQCPLGSVASYLIYVDMRLHIPMTHRNDAGTKF